MLLVDVLEKFENNSLKNYGLCPSHHLSAPGLSWDAMLNMTKQLIIDPAVYIFFEKVTRGGISYISNRYSKVNKKYLKSFESKQESRYIISIEINNFCGYAKSKFLPTSRFKWIDPEEFFLNKYISNTLR